jgi:hypothetical protein
MGIDGNEIADEFALQGSLHPIIGPEPVLGIAAEVAKGGSGTGLVGNIRSIGRPYMVKGKRRVLFKIPSAKRAGELINLSRKQLRILTGLLIGHCHLKGCV